MTNGAVMTDIEFCLLGPVVVHSNSVVIPVPGGKPRAVLAALLLSQGQVVQVEDLAETLWGADPPPSARVTIQNHVMRLRRALGDEGSRITTWPHGYRIHVDASELDVSRFEAALSAARTAARNQSWASAAGEARRALALWRGEPLADADSDLLAMRDVPRLAELRLQAQEIRISADLHLGQHAEVITELRQLVSVHPLREQLHADLMLALYRAGRQTEALAAYQDAREVLVEAVGSEPGTRLREVHQQILTADPALIADDAAAPRPGPATAVPRELPADVRHFTGRATELATLSGLLDEAAREVPRTVVISAIDGTAGVGKTALAVHWAYQVADKFPDGQLYVNMRGYDPGQPMTAADALARFLRSLGVPGQDIPSEEDERATRYRSRLAGKQMLIMLDNVGSADQVRLLLPGTPACTVVVTSRDALAGLVATDGATRLDLDVLPLNEAIALLRTLLGERVDAEPDAAARLVTQCCGLPLALRVAAELATTRPATSLDALSGELDDLHTRLDLLQACGDPRAQIRTVFSWSYHYLDFQAARTFRLFGLHPSPDFDLHAAAALTGTTVRQTRKELDTLTRAHLVQQIGPDRYGMHDLLSAYACELSAISDASKEQHAALTRLFDHYLYSAAAAMDTLFPAERHRRPRIPTPATQVPPLADLAAARDWLDAERAALVAVTAHAAAHGRPGHATRLAVTLSRYLYNGGHIPEARTLFGHALSAARRTRDGTAEATALTEIGQIDWQQGRFQQASIHYRQALALFRATGDRAGEARTLGNLGLIENDLGHYEQAARHHQRAVTISRDISDRFSEARALGNLGLTRQLQGRYGKAVSYHQQALDRCRELGDREGEAWALARLGVVDLRAGRYQPAARYLEQALDIFQDMGNRADEAEILILLGEVYLGLGRYEQATGNFEQALVTFRETGARAMEASALNGLAEGLVHTGDVRKARTHYTTALRLATQAGTPREQARAHSGLARTSHASGDPLQARQHWQEALTRYEAIGAPEAGEIRACLTRAGDDSDDNDTPAKQENGATVPPPDDPSSRADPAPSPEP